MLDTAGEFRDPFGLARAGVDGLGFVYGAGFDGHHRILSLCAVDSEIVKSDAYLWTFI